MLRTEGRRFARLTAMFCMLLMLTVLLASTPALAQEGQGQPDAPGREAAIGKINAAFQQAAREFDVPRDLLVAIAYGESRFNDHGGKPSIANGYGVMHLAENPYNHTLSEAATHLGVSEETLKTDTPTNIRGAAAVLRAYADELGLDRRSRKDLEAWYPVVARYSGSSTDTAARFYADEVYAMIGRGIAGDTRDGERIRVLAQALNPRRGDYEDVMTIQSQDYPDANWVPADSSNYTSANRPYDYPINYVIIHVTQGSYAGTISWFQNPDANVSAHYVIRSSDGEITQMVRNKDIAWHAGNWTYNTESIGIEHEGWVDDPAWFTDAMYKASAALTRYICDQYGIPKTRSHIIGHNEVPGATHTDPGPYWDWDYYMQLVTDSGWSQTIDNSDSRVSASSNWATSSWNSQRYGADYYYTTPQSVSDAAWYRFNIPATDNYEVFAWYPADSGYNSATPYVMATSSGNQAVWVDQRVNGGRWNSLGTFHFNAGDYDAVAVSRWTSASGYVIADAVRLERR